MSKPRRGRDAPERLEPDFTECIPETYFSDFSDSRAKSRARKRAQLCSQAARVISTALECDVHDDAIRALALDRVVQDPDGARLCVTFVAPAGADLVDINHRLQRVVGVFKDALARGLSRKRVPNLSLSTVPGLLEGRWNDAD